MEVQKNIIKNDNITLEIEINHLNEIIKKLNDEYNKGAQLKNDINAIVQGIKDEDEAKAKIYEKNVLEPLEKRLYDIKQITIIKEQSIMALEFIRGNNKEIIRNIDRIKNVTVTALNTAVIVAKSLFNQKIILKSIGNIQIETGNFIEDTGKILQNENLRDENDFLESDNITILKKAFENAFTTIDEMSLQNKKIFPENELKIIELKKEGEYYEKK